ncbi:MAG: hypothetical protein VYB54_07560 [Pseudomonadota bacterium]|nr:hypothetical protein [Pseudomonadota bacterium]
MATFVCWLFRGNDFDRRKVMTYTPAHVATLAAMLQRHGGHRLVCVSDMDVNVPGVRVIPMPRHVSALISYYPKLWAFSMQFAEQIGERFASIDLDVVVMGDLGPLLDEPGDFRIWDSARGQPYNSSFFVMDPGARWRVWEDFDQALAERVKSRYERWCGDQGWIAHVLGPDEAVFPESEGELIRYRSREHQFGVPETAKAVFTCGPYRPDTLRHLHWVEDHYR